MTRVNNVPPTYAAVGVNYEEMDPFKIHAQHAARATDRNIERFGFEVLEWSRGESALVVRMPGGYLAMVIEGLGTKSLAADELARVRADIANETGRTYYDHLAQCNVAMAFNDLITVGALPFLYGQYVAVGDSAWFANQARASDLVNGTRHACDLARSTWGGGETPTLRGIIREGTCDLAGASVGWVANEHHLIHSARICPGDAIVIVESSGIHANYLTMARNIASRLPDGYLTSLPSGRSYGEALLDPTHIYVRFIENCQKAWIPIHYAVNITGHGWRKLMRARQPFTYEIEVLPNRQEIFDAIIQAGGISAEEAWGNMNMGGGFAVYVPESYVDATIAAAAADNKIAIRAGTVRAGPRQVKIEPVGVTFSEDALQLR